MNNTKMGTSAESGVRTKRWGQMDLALVELARMNREIASFRPTVRDSADRAHLESLVACRGALLRLVAREMEVPDA